MNEIIRITDPVTNKIHINRLNCKGLFNSSLIIIDSPIAIIVIDTITGATTGPAQATGIKTGYPRKAVMKASQ